MSHIPDWLGMLFLTFGMLFVLAVIDLPWKLSRIADELKRMNDRAEKSDRKEKA